MLAEIVYERRASLVRNALPVHGAGAAAAAGEGRGGGGGGGG